MVENLPAKLEKQVRPLGLEEGNGNPLQYSCLENPMDRGTRCGLQSIGLQKSQT